MGKIIALILLLAWWPALSQAGMGLSRVKEISPSYLTESNGAIFFSANDSVNGSALWKSDGTRAGTKVVKSFDTGGLYKLPKGLIDANGTLYFCAYESNSGWELWKSDGTEAGTTMVKDINTGTKDGVSDNYCHLVYLDGNVFFPGIDASNGGALWKTDGTLNNTVLVHDQQPSSPNGIPQYLFVMNNTLFFTSNDAIHGYEWWKCEGPAYNTASIVTDIWTGIFAGVSVDGTRRPVVIGSYFYFQGNNGSDGSELWRSNGTALGTEMVKDINTSGSSAPSYFTAVGGILFFRADDGTSGRELWKSDGTADNTSLVKDIDVVSDSNPSNLTTIGTSLYFSANDGTNGIEVWQSDGTDGGTVMIKDINTSDNSSPRNFIELGNEVYFRADDGTNGAELWKTNGTVGNADLVENIGPGSDSSWPGNFLIFNDALFFRATYNNSASEGEGDALFRYGEKTNKLFWPMFLPTIIIK